MNKIFVADPAEIDLLAQNILEANGFELYYLLNKVSSSDILGIFIKTHTLVNKEFLDKFSNLKFVLRAGVGLDNIDLKECKKRNIKVYNSPGSNSNAVSEYVIFMILAWFRKIPSQALFLYNGVWRSMANIGLELQNKTVGLIGCGNVGKSIAQKLSAFGCKVLGYDPFVSSQDLEKSLINKTTLEYLLKNSDIISLQLPLTAKTRHFITIREFSKMKRSAFFINVSRGKIINEADLINALSNKTIAGAALDVFENEPNINQELLKVDNLTLTPHIAGFTREAQAQMSFDVVNNFLKGKTYEQR